MCAHAAAPRARSRAPAHLIMYALGALVTRGSCQLWRVLPLASNPCPAMRRSRSRIALRLVRFLHAKKTRVQVCEGECACARYGGPGDGEAAQGGPSRRAHLRARLHARTLPILLPLLLHKPVPHPSNPQPSAPAHSLARVLLPLLLQRALQAVGEVLDAKGLCHVVHGVLCILQRSLCVAPCGGGIHEGGPMVQVASWRCTQQSSQGLRPPAPSVAPGGGGCSW